MVKNGFLNGTKTKINQTKKIMVLILMMQKKYLRIQIGLTQKITERIMEKNVGLQLVWFLMHY